MGGRADGLRVLRRCYGLLGLAGVCCWRLNAGGWLKGGCGWRCGRKGDARKRPLARGLGGFYAREVGGWGLFALGTRLGALCAGHSAGGSLRWADGGGGCATGLRGGRRGAAGRGTAAAGGQAGERRGAGRGGGAFANWAARQGERRRRAGGAGSGAISPLPPTGALPAPPARRRPHAPWRTAEFAPRRTVLRPEHARLDARRRRHPARRSPAA